MSSYQLEINSTKDFNKSTFSLILNNLFLGWLSNLQVKGFSIYSTLLSILKYIFTTQTLQTLSESEIRIIDGSVLVRGKLCNYYQLQIQNLGNLTPENLQIELIKRVDFLEYLKNFGQLELYWYDRPERVSDHQNYFSQLEKYYNSKSVKQLQPSDLRQKMIYNKADLEEQIGEIISKQDSRIRECFVVISTACDPTRISNLKTAQEKLEIETNNLLTVLKNSNFGTLKVEGEHLNWLLLNFVSHTVNY